MKNLIFVAIVVVLFGGCVRLIKEYPEIKYYRLSQELVTLRNLGKIPGILLLRDVAVSDDVDSDNMIATWDSSSIQQYNYHKWISSPGEMVTDFIANRLNFSGGFGGSVVRTGSLIMPDFVLEAKVTDMMAFSSSENEDENFVHVSAHIAVSEFNREKSEAKFIESKSYSIRIQRDNNSATSIAPAYSKAFSQLVDKMIVDIQRIMSTNQQL